MRVRAKSTVMTSPGPAFQKFTWSCNENGFAPKAVSSELGSTDGLTVLARIEIVVILVNNETQFSRGDHTVGKPSADAGSLCSEA